MNVKQFAEKNKISEKLAKKILNALYDKNLDATKMNRVIWRLESFFIKEKLKQYLEKVDKKQIESVIEDIIADDAKYEADSISASEVHMRLFSELKFAEEKPEGHKYKAGDTVEIQIMRTGSWNHALYGKFSVAKKDLKEVVDNFNNDTRGVKLAVDENHEPNHKALAWYESLSLENNGEAVFAKLTLTAKGAKLLSEGAYRYFSPELIFKKKDEETGKTITNLLIGGAFTNRPFFKSMKPLMASEDKTGAADQSAEQNILFFNCNNQMNKFLELVSKFAELDALTKEQADQLKKAFSELPKEDQKNEATLSLFNETVGKFNDEGAGDDAGADDDQGGADDQGADGGDDAEGDDDGDDSDDGDDDGADTPAIEASEPNAEGMVQVKFSDLETLKSTASLVSKLVREKRQTQFSEKVDALAFSEKGGAELTPKSKKAIIGFALSLSEKQAEKFFSILDGVQIVSASETGSSTTPSAEMAGNIEKNEAIKYYTETLNMSQEEAEAAFAEIQKESSK